MPPGTRTSARLVAPGQAVLRGPVLGWDAAGPDAARGPGRWFLLGEALPAAGEAGEAGAGTRARRDVGDGGGDLPGLCVAERVGERQPGQRQRGFLEVSPCVAASMCASLGLCPGVQPRLRIPWSRGARAEPPQAAVCDAGGFVKGGGVGEDIAEAMRVPCVPRPADPRPHAAVSRCWG